jgi:hypothetical protein
MTGRGDVVGFIFLLSLALPLLRGAASAAHLRMRGKGLEWRVRGDCV